MGDHISPQEAIRAHPYVTEQGGEILDFLLSDSGFEDVTRFEIDVLENHTENPIDLLIGDDVSGRVPTLITHHFLRLAQACGRIEATPRAFFMTSGVVFYDDSEKMQEVWQDNLSEHAKRILGSMAVKQVAVITELVTTGRSFKRLENAFIDKGAQVRRFALMKGDGLYLLGSGSPIQDRQAVGVEKYVPEPTSRRHSKFDGSTTAKLRYFLRDYAGAVYETIFDEQVTEMHNLTPQPILPIAASQWKKSRTKKGKLPL